MGGNIFPILEAIHTLISEYECFNDAKEPNRIILGRAKYLELARAYVRDVGGFIQRHQSRIGTWETTVFGIRVVVDQDVARENAIEVGYVLERFPMLEGEAANAADHH